MRASGRRCLRGLDGLALLERMHKREGQDCLMYWLEFKNDDEFPAIFGSIAGGSALKFGIYQSAEDGPVDALLVRAARRRADLRDEAIDFAPRAAGPAARWVQGAWRSCRRTPPTRSTLASRATWTSTCRRLAAGRGATSTST